MRVRAITHLWAGNEEVFFSVGRSLRYHAISRKRTRPCRALGIYLLSRVLRLEDVREEAKALRRLAEGVTVGLADQGWMLDVAHCGLRQKKSEP